MIYLIISLEVESAQRAQNIPELTKEKTIIKVDRWSWDWNILYSRKSQNPTIMAICGIGPKAYGSAWNNSAFLFAWGKTTGNLFLQSTDLGRYNYNGSTCSYISSPETWTGNIQNYMWWASASFYHTNNQNGKCYDLLITHSGNNCNNNIYGGLYGTAECLNQQCTQWWGDYYVAGYANGGHEYTGGFTSYAGWGLWGSDIPTTNGASYLFIMYNSASNNNNLAIAIHRNPFDTQQRGEQAAFVNNNGIGTGLSACEATIQTGNGNRWGVAWMGLDVGAGDYVSYFGWYRIWDIAYRNANSANFGGLFRWTHNGNYRWTGFAAVHNNSNVDLNVHLTDIHSSANLCVNQRLASSEQTTWTTDFVLIDFNRSPATNYINGQWWAKVPRYGSQSPTTTGIAQAWDGDSITISQICTSPIPPCQNSPITFTFNANDLIKVWDIVFNYSCSNGWIIKLTRTSGTLTNVRMSLYRPGNGVYQTRANAYLNAIPTYANPVDSIIVPNPPADGYIAQYGLVVYRGEGSTIGTSSTYQLSAYCTGVTPVQISEDIKDIKVYVKNGKLVLTAQNPTKISIEIYSSSGSVVYSAKDMIINGTREINLKKGIYFYNISNKEKGKVIIN